MQILYPQLFDPITYFEKRFFVSEVEEQQKAHGITIEGRCETTESKAIYAILQLCSYSMLLLIEGALLTQFLFNKVHTILHVSGM